MDLQKLIVILQGYLSSEFKALGIPLGNHDIIFHDPNGIIIEIRSLNSKCSYPQVMNPQKFTEDLQDLMLTEIKVVEVTETSFRFKVINDTGYQWCRKLLLGTDSKGIFNQLRNHRLKTFNRFDAQSLFDKLCNYDHDYYNQVYLENWADNVIVDNYDNFKIIEVLAFLADVKYENLFGLIGNYGNQTLGLLRALLPKIRLDNPHKNYELAILSLKDPELLKLLLNNFLEFKDRGLLIEYIRDQHSDDVFEILINFKFTIVDTYTLNTAIEYNHLKMINYIIKERTELITEETFRVCRNFNRDNLFRLMSV